MTIRKRLERLEHAIGLRYPQDRCSHCRDWPWLDIQSKTVAEILAGEKTEHRHCPSCGWSPNVITEVVVETHEEVLALRAHQERMGLAGIR